MANQAVQISNLTVYYGQTEALDNICLDVAEGEYLGIIGPNGGGKSTLIKAMLGLLPVTSGKIEIFGGDVEKNRHMMSYVPQFASMDRRFPISLREVVLTGTLPRGLKPFHRYSAKDIETAEEMLSRVGLGQIMDRRVSDLSGGQFQKLMIARALTRNPRILLLDEPTASVDAVSREQIFSLLSELNKQMTVILVTHDLFAISSQVHSLACLNKKLVYHGAPELTQSVVETLYGCPVDLIAHGVPHRVLGKHNDEGGDHHDCCDC